MKTNEVKNLLHSFYEAETTPEEELLLRNYFNSNDVAHDLLEEKKIFLAIAPCDVIETPDQLEFKIDTLITNLEQENKKKLSFSSKISIRWISIAASIVLLVTAGFYLSQSSMNGDDLLFVEDVSYTSDPEIDLLKIEKALILLSSNFNKGIKQIDDMQSSFDKTSTMLEEMFK